ncbi:MAG: VWA domain-containing protein, partial [Alistipes sp.]|nr:VWA domain-containing protein [Alistipes sp.]
MTFDITRFANPWVLWLLFLLLPVVAYYVYRTLQGGAAIQVSTVAGVEGAGKSFRYYLRHLPFVFRCVAYGLLVFALARPQTSEYGSNSITEGIDIMLTIDVSSSMLARDLKPDRFTAARETAAKFIVDRTTARYAIVVYPGNA